MKFSPTALADAWIIDIEPREDARGFFARSVCVEEFDRHGLENNFVQQSISWNPNIATLRGLHFQQTPYEEDKLVRATQGAIFDVIVDLRMDSSTYLQWYGVELSASNRRQIFVPKGFAHGFQTLESDTEVLYQMTAAYHPDASSGFRFDDPAFGIDWPLPVDEANPEKISVADLNLPRWQT